MMKHPVLLGLFLALSLTAACGSGVIQPGGSVPSAGRPAGGGNGGFQ